MVLLKSGGVIFFSVVLLMIFSCEQKPAPSPVTRKAEPVISKSEEMARRYNLDKSPMDMIYFPDDFPVLKMSGKSDKIPVARVIYSRPSKDGRFIFGNVVKYGTYWRLGANEGTEIEFFSEVSIMGKKVKKGRYIMYCVPYENKWAIKFNDDLYAWGLRIHSARDLYSFEVPIQHTSDKYELLSMKFENGEGNSGKLMIAWDDVIAYLHFTH